MIAVSDIVLKMRSRLNDKDSEKYRWSDEELIDCINSSLVEIETELNNTIHLKYIKTVENQNRYKLPKDTFDFITVRLENRVLDKKSLIWHEENIEDAKDYTYYYTDEKSLYIHAPFIIEDDMELRLAYSYIEQVESIEDEIQMNIILKDALLFYALFLAYQVPTSDKNLKQESKYYSLYEIQIDKKRPLIFRNKHGKKIRSKYKKV